MAELWFTLTPIPRTLLRIPRSRPRIVDGMFPVESRRRVLRIALGLIWLLDAALQFQPYMFTRAFVTQAIRSTASGNPKVVADPIAWSASFMSQHIAAYNAIFATIQLLLGLGLLYPRTVKLALAASIPWAVGVWWIGEGLGGVLAGVANPVTGAPGAAILYAFLALLAWPGAGGSPVSVAAAGRLGAVAPRVLWAGLWASFACLLLRPADRTPGALAGIASGMRSGEPNWIGALDGGLAHALAHSGPVVAIAAAALCATAAVTVGTGRLSQLGVLAAVVVACFIWLMEDFGGILTGQGTDPNTGPLLLVLAFAFWPIGHNDRGYTSAAPLRRAEETPAIAIAASYPSRLAG